MREHRLKCWPNAYAAIRAGRKRFEWRKDDRGFEVGDVLVLKLWDPQLRDPWQSTCEAIMGPRGWYAADTEPLIVVVTYILRGMFDVPNGYCVMSIEPIMVKVETTQDAKRSPESTE
jgi:hypothetical protein